MKINQNDSVFTLYNTTIFKSAEVSHQNWNHTILSIWLLAGRGFMNMFAHANFTLKSQARIKIFIIWTTFTEPLCAIRIMFSVVWRAAFRLQISLFPRRPISGPKWVFFSEFLQHHKYKWKSIKLIAFDILQYQHIKNQPRFLIKIETLQFGQFGYWPGVLLWTVLLMSTLP